MIDDDDLIDFFAGFIMLGAIIRNGIYEVTTESVYDLAEAMLREKEKRLERKRQ